MEKTQTIKTILISLLIFSLIGLTAGEDLQKLPLLELEQQVETGNAEAQAELARRYAYGEGVPRDYEKCYKLAVQAAERGNAHAMRTVAACYMRGVGGVERDRQKALEWINRAAEAGDIVSLGNVGVMYYLGEGVKCDVQKGVHMFEQAAKGGDTNAQYKLGIAYIKGDGVPKDEEKGL